MSISDLHHSIKNEIEQKEEEKDNTNLTFNLKNGTKIYKELLKLDSVYDGMALQRKELTDMMSRLKQGRDRIYTLINEEPKQKKTSENKKRGLSKPFMVSPALCQFLDVPTGSLIARAAVTQYIHSYIKKENLYAENNHSYIIPDQSLSKLLETPHDEPVHIFDIPGKMNSHFNYA